MKPAQNLERRDKARLPYICPINVKDLISGASCSARIFNYSDTGVYFESDALLESGTEVYIGLRHSLFEDLPSDYTCYRTTIMWRKEMPEDSHFHLRLRQPKSSRRKSPIMRNSPASTADIPQAFQSADPVCGRPVDFGRPRR